MINDIDDSKAPLLDHLIELRGRLLKCVYALAITGALCFYFS
ncbi:MAG TPA: twin-arginine translocase subunit TatC, partial [Sphingobium sp.]|nr:twin-arginine translocase subunit TatC [Sphingobium sp.]